MSRLTRDETAQPVSRDQFLRRELGQGNIHFESFPVQLTTSMGSNIITRFIHTLLLYVMTIYIIYIYQYNVCVYIQQE